MLPIKTQVRATFNKDGVDHVNISAYSETELGKICSPDWRKTFFVPHVGDFITPRAFANWMVSGGKEALRHSTSFYRTTAPVADFRLLLLFAKYYQLCGMRSNLMPAKGLTNLAWVMYKKHISGVREFDRWEVYPAEVKEMVKHIIANGSKSHYTWSESNPQVIRCLNFYLELITGDDFIPFEELNRITKEKAAERSASDKAKAEDGQDSSSQASSGESEQEQGHDEDFELSSKSNKAVKPVSEADLQRQFHLQQLVQPVEHVNTDTSATI